MTSYCSLPSSGVGRLSPATKVRRSPHACSFRGEDNKRNLVNYESSEGLRGKKARRSVVDENMEVLRERMEEVKVKERLLRRWQGHVTRRDYQFEQYNPKKLKGGDNSAVQGVQLVLGCLGLPILGGTLCLCLVSLLLHLLGA